jgi:GST-like protein
VIELYTWPTPNGQKASIMLEETGLAYHTIAVDLGREAQFQPEFLKVSPNNKIPAIVDYDGSDGVTSVFESGAILIYLAEKTGILLPQRGLQRASSIQWLFWAISGVGPAIGRLGGALSQPNLDPAVLVPMEKEVARLMNVLSGQLSLFPFLAQEYSIADIAAFTWVQYFRSSLKELSAKQSLEPVDRWLREIAARPAVQRGLRPPKPVVRVPVASS